MKDQEKNCVSLLYFGTRYYNSDISVWLSVDPLSDKYPSLSPYNYCAGNPVMLVDPDGRDFGEFELIDGEWQKTSTKGDNIGIDFYHHPTQKDGSQRTEIRNKGERAPLNTIKEGQYTINGKSRDEDINYKTIYNEYKEGTGPERSYIEGDNIMSEEIKSHYLYQEAYENFINSGQDKGAFEVDWGLRDIIQTGGNMTAQMLGSYNVSFYKMDDRVLTIIQDTKSIESFYYHIPNISPSREEGRLLNPYDCFPSFTKSYSETTTYQTYIFFN